jgi:hypothetical protein
VDDSNLADCFKAAKQDKLEDTRSGIFVELQIKFAKAPFKSSIMENMPPRRG